MVVHPRLLHLHKVARVKTLDFLACARREKASLCQKFRVHWLQLGDQNFACFHRQMNARVIRNGIDSVTSSDGEHVTDPTVVTETVVNYYRDFLGTQCLGYRDLSSKISDIVGFAWPAGCGEDLVRSVTNGEV